jgi:hypothetical protein
MATGQRNKKGVLQICEGNYEGELLDSFVIGSIFLPTILVSALGCMKAFSFHNHINTSQGVKVFNVQY